MIYGFRARIAYLILSTVTLVLYLVNAFDATRFFDSTILGWAFVLFLFGTNSSRITNNAKADRSSRYKALIYGFGVTIVTLMAFSFTQMVSSSPDEGDIGEAFLLVGLIGNVVFLGVQYAVYWRDKKERLTTDS